MTIAQIGKPYYNTCVTSGIILCVVESILRFELLHVSLLYMVVTKDTVICL